MGWASSSPGIAVLQRVVFMKLKNLFFCMTCVLILNCIVTVVAQGDDSALIDGVPAKVITLVENICNLLQHGHSADDVMTILNDNKGFGYDIGKLVTCMQELFNKQYSKKDVIKIIILNRKEFEQSLARENEWAKSSFIRHVIVFMVIVIAVYYIAQWLWSLLPAAWFGGGPPKSQISRAPPPVLEAQKSDLPPTLPKDIPSSLPLQKNVNVPSRDDSVQVMHVVRQQDQAVDEPSEQGVLREEWSELFGPYNISGSYNASLAKKVAQQVEHAKSIGLELAKIESGAIKIAKKPRDNRTFGEKMQQQIEYAKRIGLLPDH